MCPSGRWSGERACEEGKCGAQVDASTPQIAATEGRRPRQAEVEDRTGGRKHLTGEGSGMHKCVILLEIFLVNVLKNVGQNQRI